MAAKKEAPNYLSDNNAEVARRSNMRKQLLQRYAAEEKVSISISPLYKPYFGKVMNVTINGINIRFPVDGSTHKIPKTFAAEIRGRIMAIDAINEKGKKMADVKTNYEKYPGELKMF